ncbi:CAP domain-containing protein [Halorientalis sp.]|uniref:CAP domain-containing protein n=1 Tax=Halorientalis sp. TaxID=1931229 RepID=UPI002602D8D0|nr:CAP domain-containing protein [Halorientalis sp.]
MKRAIAASLLLLTVAVSLPVVADGLQSTPERVANSPSGTPPPVTTTDTDTGETSTERAVAESVTVTPSGQSAAVDAPDEADEGALNETRLERALAAAINDYRHNPIRNDVLDGTLETNTTVARRLGTLARNHSARMARLHLAAPTAGETRPADHYAAVGLDSSCRMRHQYESYLRPLSDLELVTSVDPNGTNETVTANAVVDRWFADRTSRETLTIRNANHVGTGVVTADGIAYVTVALC